MNRIGLINYGLGNVTSVRNALDYLGADVTEVHTPAGLDAVGHLILPGVGAFAATMERLRERGWVEALRRHVLEKGKWLLGICVGMQVLADTGSEFGTCAGLGFLRGSVDAIDVGAHGLPMPHMGWNVLEVHRPCPLLEEISDAPCFYFVHGYQLRSPEPDATVATCQYGDTVTACVQKENAFGVQFHPEKSQRDGLQVLRNFCEL
jgi:glutamine amidotransferase